MFKRPIIVFNGTYVTKEYYTFKKNGKWCTCDGANIALYLPKDLGNKLRYLLNCEYSEGECDGQFEDAELHF